MKIVKLNELHDYENYIIAKDIFYEGNLVVKSNSILTRPIISQLEEFTTLENIYVYAKKHGEGLCMKEILHQKIIETTNGYIDTLFKNYSYNDRNDAKLIKDIIRLFIKDILNEQFFKNYLENVLLISEDLFNHQIRVLILSIMLSIKANLKRNIIREIGIGALMHDCGKIKLMLQFKFMSNISHQMSYEEFQLFKTHAKLGYMEVADNPLIPILSKKIILLHHMWEYYDASFDNIVQSHISYPKNINGKELNKTYKNDFIRIVQVANTFDNIVNQCGNTICYPRSNNPKDAIDYIWNNRKNEFGNYGALLIKNFISQYSIGDQVKLSDGTFGTVIEHTQDVNNPKIKINGENKIVNLLKYKDLNILEE